MTRTSQSLVFGTVLLLALASAPSAFADDSYARIVQISYVDGEVYITQGTSSRPLKVRNFQPLENGALLDTQDGVVEIEFEDDLVARVAENSQLHFSELVLRDDGGRFTRLGLRQGTGSFSARLKQYDSFLVVTPYFTVTALGKSKFRVDLTDQGGRVKVLSGKVEVETPEEVLEVSKGRQLEWNAAQSQVALGPADEPDGWDEFTSEREKALNAARRARQWSVYTSNYSYAGRGHYGHSHRFGYCPYYSYGHGFNYQLSYYRPAHWYWSFGFGYPIYYTSYYPAYYYPAYYPIYVSSYYYGGRRHRSPFRFRPNRTRHGHGTTVVINNFPSGSGTATTTVVNADRRRRSGRKGDRDVSRTIMQRTRARTSSTFARRSRPDRDATSVVTNDTIRRKSAAARKDTPRTIVQRTRARTSTTFAHKARSRNDTSEVSTTPKRRENRSAVRKSPARENASSGTVMRRTRARASSSSARTTSRSARQQSSRSAAKQNNSRARTSRPAVSSRRSGPSRGSSSRQPSASRSQSRSSSRPARASSGSRRSSSPSRGSARSYSRGGKPRGH